MLDPQTVEALKNMPEPTNDMSDMETAMQSIKIFLLVVGLIVLIAGILQLNHNITTLIKQQGEMITLLKR